MADDRRPVDPAAQRPEQEPAPGFDPVHPANDPAVERDPAAGTARERHTTVVTSNSRGGVYIAALIAVVAIIAAIVAMNWDWGNPQATIMPADPAAMEETAPAAEDGTTAPADTQTTAPAGTAEPAPEPTPAE
ncbi:MAG: hypothetical protein ACK4F5_02555 [Aliihoeflea sp.]